MWDKLDATISGFIGNQLFLNTFRASWGPSSGGQTAFSLPMVFCPVVAVVMVESWMASNLLHTVHAACHPTVQNHNSYKRTENHRQWSAVWPPDDGRKDARNMLRNNWLTIKSLIVASSWSHLYLLIKDARSFEHQCNRYSTTDRV